jgi:hypothetical protein
MIQGERLRYSMHIQGDLGGNVVIACIYRLIQEEMLLYSVHIQGDLGGNATL